jgi:hypothetical protein
VIGRTQTNCPDDYEAVHAIQDGYTVTPLHAREHTIDPTEFTETEPLRLVNGMGFVEFFTYACEALAVNPPHATDFSVLARIAKLGIVPGERAGLASTQAPSTRPRSTRSKRARAPQTRCEHQTVHTRPRAGQSSAATDEFRRAGRSEPRRPGRRRDAH